jgi:hypothetical protein
MQRDKGPALVAGEDHMQARCPVVVHARKPAFLLFSYEGRGVLYIWPATALDDVDTGNSGAAYVLDPVADQITHVEDRRTGHELRGSGQAV